MAPSLNHEKRRGVSLLEILLVISLFSILLGVGVSQWSHLLHTNESKVEVQHLVTLLNFARNQAIYLAETVQVKPVRTDWHDGVQVVDIDQRVLREIPPMKGAKQLVWNSSLGKDEALGFQANGFTQGQRGTFYYCAKKAALDYSRGIVIIETGRIRVKTLEKNEYQSHCA